MVTKDHPIPIHIHNNDAYACIQHTYTAQRSGIKVYVNLS
jgi:hypothetical protein